MAKQQSAKEWLRDNDFGEVAEQIERLEARWQEDGKTTRRSWWQVLAGTERGKPRVVDGIRFPVLGEARKRQGLPPLPATGVAPTTTKSKVRAPRPAGATPIPVGSRKREAGPTGSLGVVPAVAPSSETAEAALSAGETAETSGSELIASEFPRWIQTEAQVEAFFTLMGFNAEHITVAGRQIDLIATRANDLLHLDQERWAIEITVSKVDAKKGASDTVKLLTAKADGKANHLMLVSTEGFTGDQAASLKKLGIVALTLDELESAQLNLKRYAAVQRTYLIQQNDVDIGFDAQVFVPPRIKLRRDPDSPDVVENESALEWVHSVVERKDGVVGALLGDLGTGKTTLLQRAQLDYIEKYERSPSTTPLIFLYVIELSAL